MWFKYLKDFSLFLLLFVSFNDTISTDMAGNSIIKLALALFVALHASDYYQILISPKQRHVRAFLLFFVVLSVVTLLSNILFFDNTLLVGFMRLFAIFALFMYFSHNRELDKVLYMLWVIMIFSSIVAYFSDPEDIWSFRKSGGTQDPNDFAAQLLFIIFVTVYLFQKNKNWFFLLGSLGFFTYTLLYAGSKSSLIFLALILFVTFMVKFKTIMIHLFSLKGLLASSVLIAALVVGIMQSSQAVEGLQGRAQKTGTFEQRLIVWRAGGEMIRDHFFMGVGFGEFPKVSGKYVKDFLAEEARPSHNIFIKVFAESGVFSFMAFVFFIWMLFASKIREIIRGPYFWIYLGSGSVILMGMTIPSLHHKDFWVMLAVWSNVLFLVAQRHDDEAVEVSPNKV